MNHTPTATTLLGAMVDDEVPEELALRIATAYRVARESYAPEHVHQWLMALLANLGTGHPQTSLVAYAAHSDLAEDHYTERAATYGWGADLKE